VAGEQHGVGQEVGELDQVVAAAVREVGVCLGDDATGHSGQLHQLGVGRLLPTEHDDRAGPGE
jgi:hypothetical protein